jgi:hypothetical protein
VEDNEFCLVETELVPTFTDFDGLVGFGKPARGDYDSIMGSTVGQLWEKYEYCPIATFDYNFADQDSSVTIGCYDDAI